MSDEKKPAPALPGEPGKSGVKPTPIDKPPAPPTLEQQLADARTRIFHLTDVISGQAKTLGNLEARLANYLAKERRGECPFQSRSEVAAVELAQLHQDEPTEDDPTALRCQRHRRIIVSSRPDPVHRGALVHECYACIDERSAP